MTIETWQPKGDDNERVSAAEMPFEMEGIDAQMQASRDQAQLLDSERTLREQLKILQEENEVLRHAKECTSCKRKRLEESESESESESPRKLSRRSA